MKNYILILMLCAFHPLAAQQQDKYSAIKLYVDRFQIAADNRSNLKEDEIERLYQRTLQLVNQDNITEIGYSNFLVSPRFMVYSTSIDNAGTMRTFLTECEFFITIKRLNIERKEDLGAATFNTFSKKIMGSGFTKEESISNALSNIRPSDEDILDFFTASKNVIDEYYRLHCNDVLVEAQQAKNLKNYVKAISLFFSVPANSPCYVEAHDAAENVYQTYIDDKCEKQMALMRNYAALAQKDGSAAEIYYGKIIDIINDISPSSKACYAAANTIIEKIEKNLDDRQKQDWELRKIYSADEKEMAIQRYKEIQKLSENYRPSGSTVIITK